MRELFLPGTLLRAGLLLCCISGKLAMGVFAPPPRTGDQFWTLAFAWGEWGEFSFLIATVAKIDEATGVGILDQQTYNAIVLAVLVSIVLCPFGLRRTLDRVAEEADAKITEAIVETVRDDTRARRARTHTHTRACALCSESPACPVGAMGGWMGGLTVR